MEGDELTMLEALFVNEYCTDWNATTAFKRLIEMGFHNEVKWPNHHGYKILKIPRVRAEVEMRREKLLKIGELNAEMVVRDIRAVMTANVQELSEHHQDCCRHCYGIDNDYQFTKAEMKKARRAHEMMTKTPFDEQGGDGFDPRLAPVDDCPECHGRGVMTIISHDTRTMSAAAASLYMGVKAGKHGTEVLLRSKDQARKDAAAILGLNKETINLLTKNAKEMTDEELEAFIASQQGVA